MQVQVRSVFHNFGGHVKSAPASGDVSIGSHLHWLLYVVKDAAFGGLLSLKFPIHRVTLIMDG